MATRSSRALATMLIRLGLDATDVHAGLAKVLGQLAAFQTATSSGVQAMVRERKNADREAEKSARAAAKAAEKADKDAARERIKAAKSVEKAAVAAARATAKEQERAAREAAKTAKRLAAEQQRAALAAARAAAAAQAAAKASLDTDMSDFMATAMGMRRSRTRLDAGEGQRMAADRARRTAAAMRELQVQSVAATRALTDMANSVLSGLNKIGIALGISGAAFGAYSTAVGASYEKQVSFLAAILGITDKTSQAYEALDRQARKIGATTALTATEAAEAMQVLAQAGMEVTDIISASDAAVKFALGNQATLDRSANLIAATLTQFSLGGSEAARVADAMGMAARSSLLDVESLAEAMKYAGTTGAAFGWSVEETLAAVAQFRNLGLEGSQAGTNLRMAMVAAAAPMEKNIKLLKRYGLTVDDINPALHSFKDVMLNIARAGMSTADMFVLFDRRAGANVKAIADRMLVDGGAAFDELLGKLENSAGTTEELYQASMNNVLGQFEVLKSAMEELGISFFEAFKTPLREALRSAGEFVNRIIGVVRQRQGTLSGSFRDLFGPLEEFFDRSGAAIGDSITGWVRALVELRNVLSTIAAPLLALTGGVEGLITKLDDLAIIIATAYGTAKLVAMAGSITRVVVSIQALSAASAAAGTSFSGGLLASITAATGGFAGLGIAIAGVIGGLVWLYQHNQDDPMEWLDKERAATAERVAANMQLFTGVTEESAESLRVATMHAIDLAEATGKATREAIRLRSELEAASAADVKRRVEAGELGVMPDGTLNSIRGIVRMGSYDDADGLAASIDAMNVLRTKRLSEIDALRRELGSLDVANPDVQRRLSEAGTRARNRSEQLAATFPGITSDEALEGRKVELREIIKLREGEIAQIDDTYKRESELFATEEAHRKKQLSDLKDSGRETENLNDELRNTERVLDDIAGLFDRIKKLVEDTVAELGALQLERRDDEFEQSFAPAYEADRRRRQQLVDIEGDFARRIDDAPKKKRAGLQAEFESWKAKFLQKASAALREQLLLIAEGIGEIERAKSDAFYDRVDGLMSEARGASVTTMDPFASSETDNEYDRLGKSALKAVADLEALREELDRIGAFREPVAGERRRAEIDDLIFQNRTAAGLYFKKSDAMKAVDPSKLANQRKAQDEEDKKRSRESSDRWRKFMGVVNMTIRQASNLAGLFQRAIGGVFRFFETFLGQRLSVTSMIQNASRAMPDATYDSRIARTDDIKTALKFEAEAFEEGAVSFLKVLGEGLPTLTAALGPALNQVLESFVKRIPSIIGNISDLLASLATNVVPNVGDLLADFARGLPELARAFGSALGSLLSELASEAGPIAAGVTRAAVGFVSTLVEAIPEFLVSLVNALPQALRILSSNLGGIVGGLTDTLLQVLTSVFAQLPNILDSLLSGLPDMLRSLMMSLAQNLPILVRAIAKAIPTLIRVIASNLGPIIDGLLDGVIMLIQEIVMAIPDIVGELILGITEAIPQLVMTLVTLIFQLIFRYLPLIVTGLVRAIIEMVWDLIKMLGRILWASILFMFAGPKKAKEFSEKHIANGGLMRGDVWSDDQVNSMMEGYAKGFEDSAKVQAQAGYNKWQDGDKKGGKGKGGKGKARGSAYSGMSYVPANMLVQLHAGERVMSAAENRRYMEHTNGGPPMAGQPGPYVAGKAGDMCTTIEVHVDGHVVDKALVKSQASGCSKGASKLIRQVTGGTLVGVRKV